MLKARCAACGRVIDVHESHELSLHVGNFDCAWEGGGDPSCPGVLVIDED